MLQYPTQAQETSVRMVEAMSRFIALSQLASPEVLSLVARKLERGKEEGPAETRLLEAVLEFLETMKQEQEV